MSIALKVDSMHRAADKSSLEKQLRHLDIKKIISYSADDHKTWERLYTLQTENLKDLAHPRFLKNLSDLTLPQNQIPQLEEISKTLFKKAGWRIAEVTGLIDGDDFFGLLSQRVFPSTTYLRNSSELFISRDPDIFHELFGHCPFLLDKRHALLFEKFGHHGLKLDKVQRQFLQRLFWFTFETGLILESQKLKIYGGSLLSSIKESSFSLKSHKVKRPLFNTVQIFRTPYRADILQNIYYVLKDFSTLDGLLDDLDLLKRKMEIAYDLGEFPPSFSLDKTQSRYTNINIESL